MGQPLEKLGESCTSYQRTFQQSWCCWGCTALPMAPSKRETNVCAQCHKAKRPDTAVSGTTFVQSETSNGEARSIGKHRKRRKHQPESSDVQAQFYSTPNVVQHLCSPYCCDAKTYYMHEKFWGKAEKPETVGNNHIHEALRLVTTKEQASCDAKAPLLLKVLLYAMAHPRGKQPVQRRSGLVVI